MKDLLKTLLIPPLASQPVSRLARRIVGYGIPIFLVHRVAEQPQNHGCISSQHLEQCLRYLRNNGYEFISLQQLVTSLLHGHSLPEKPVVFTMDDGFADQAEIAAPIFLQYECPVTFFVISGLLDGELWPWDTKVSWIINQTRKSVLRIDFPDEQLVVHIDEPSNRHFAREKVRDYCKETPAGLLPELITQLAEQAEVALPDTPPTQHRAMVWEQARELESQGVEFAPHSVSHRILSRLSQEEVEYEIDHSRQRLQQELQQAVDIFCYPTGRILDFGPREKDILKGRGFMAAVSTLPRHLHRDKLQEQQRYNLPRFELPASMSDFIQYCSWIEHAKASWKP